MPALAPVSVPDEQSEQGCRGLETQSERFCKSLYSCRCGDGLAKYRGESLRRSMPLKQSRIWHTVDCCLMRIGQAMLYTSKHVETFPFPHTVAICYSVFIQEDASMLIAENRLSSAPVGSPGNHAQSVVNESMMPRLPPGGNPSNPKKTWRTFCFGMFQSSTLQKI